MTCKVTDLNKKCFYGQEDWEYLRREHHNFAGERRQCLWTHPVKEDAVTVVIPSLNSGSYRLVAGLDDSAVRGDLAAVELVISQGVPSRDETVDGSRPERLTPAAIAQCLSPREDQAHHSSQRNWRSILLLGFRAIRVIAPAEERG